MRWEATRIVSALKATTNLYFDRVSQIRLKRWSKGRVALVGDAAFCPSLLAGQGSALAMTASYVLAGELAQCDAGYAQGLERYEALLRSFLDAKQRGAKNLAVVFAPRTRLGLFFRNMLIRATTIHGLSRLAFGREITDRLILPEYVWI
jgi:2-polyprenyl-6-methoxyphenol hydroxylase-like FAD-dependent oxidoreductase